MSLSLSGRTAVVTGAGRGIGRATAVELARHGASVVVNDIGTSTAGVGRDASTAQAVVSEIEATGGSALASTESVSDFEGAGRIIGAAVERFGGIDILVNNAGLSAGAPIWQLEPDVFDRVTATHIQGTYHCTRHAVPHMKDKGWGRIVNLVSRSGLTGVAGSAAYGAGKGGIFGFTNVVSRDLVAFGITVNGVNPSSTDTRMVSEAIEAAERGGGAMAERAANLKAVLQAPEEVAVLIVALCSEQAASISGQFFFVRGTEVGLFRPLSVEQTTSREARWSAGDLAEALTELEPYPLDSPY
ncbi:MAG: SDR family NAD(P)-dependent oxidoreductase [Myxococcota bacterium]|nr:SDR family NAD(P)-dependent oxidoreductase [Myxococcota bacterium]